MTDQLAQRFAAWLDRRRIAVLLVSVAIAVGGIALATRLTIKSDLTNLLPSSDRSVQQLAAVQKRARSFGTVQIVIESADPALRARAGDALTRRLAALPAELVAQVSADDGPIHRYVWDHRFLFADLADLESSRDALRERIKKGKLDANPLFVQLEDDEPAPPSDGLDELDEKLADAEAMATHPPPRASADGQLQMIAVQTTFSSSDPDRTKRLLGLIQHEIDETERDVGPGVTLGLTGGITQAMYEHDSVLQGIAASLGITVLLCALALLLYFRSGKVVLLVLWALAVGVAATFALTWALLGHLNVMTAFLFAIVIGNGINAGLILVARYLEVVRAGVDPSAAVGSAISGAIRGTVAATATAAIAYTSLLVTDFRGFRQFGAIAGAGMVLTWLTTFTVLPAGLFVLARRGHIRPTRPPLFGEALARLLPARPQVVLLAGAMITAAAAVITFRFVANDPFTHDWRDLQSSTAAIRGAQELGTRVSAKLDTSTMLSGQAYQLAIAVEQRDQVGPLVTQLRGADADRPPEQRWIRDIRSIDDLLPARQPDKLAVLAEIRTLIDDPKLQASLADDERARVTKLRPPDDLRPLVDVDVPHELAWPFIERDGSIGRLILLRGASRLKSFNVDHRLAFAREVRQLELPPGALIAGESLVVAAVVETMEHDALPITLFAVLGSVLAVLIVLGLRRHAAVSLACGFAGVVVMIAVCALVGLRVHFLDLIALPITIGIGIDYAVNLAARDRQDGERGPRHLLRTIGGSVLLCSYTTTVGYSTLMLSANGGIRAFGLAALIGELACISMALLIAPAWLGLLRDRDRQAAERPGALAGRA